MSRVNAITHTPYEGYVPNAQAMRLRAGAEAQKELDRRRKLIQAEAEAQSRLSAQEHQQRMQQTLLAEQARSQANTAGIGAQNTARAQQQYNYDTYFRNKDQQQQQMFANQEQARRLQMSQEQARLQGRRDDQQNEYQVDRDGRQAGYQTDRDILLDGLQGGRDERLARLGLNTSTVLENLRNQHTLGRDDLQHRYGMQRADQTNEFQVDRDGRQHQYGMERDAQQNQYGRGMQELQFGLNEQSAQAGFGRELERLGVQNENARGLLGQQHDYSMEGDIEKLIAQREGEGYTWSPMQEQMRSPAVASKAKAMQDFFQGRISEAEAIRQSKHADAMIRRVGPPEVRPSVAPIREDFEQNTVTDEDGNRFGRTMDRNGRSSFSPLANAYRDMASKSASSKNDEYNKLVDKFETTVYREAVAAAAENGNPPPDYDELLTDWLGRRRGYEEFMPKRTQGSPQGSPQGMPNPQGMQGKGANPFLERARQQGTLSTPGAQPVPTDVGEIKRQKYEQSIALQAEQDRQQEIATALRQGFANIDNEPMYQAAAAKDPQAAQAIKGRIGQLVEQLASLRENPGPGKQGVNVNAVADETIRELRGLQQQLQKIATPPRPMSEYLKAEDQWGL